VAILLDWNIEKCSGRGELDEIDAWESFPQPGFVSISP